MKHGKNEWWLNWIFIEWQYHGIMGYTGMHVYVYIYVYIYFIEIYPPAKLTVCKLVNHRAQLVFFRYMTDGRFSSQFLVISNGMWFKRSQFKFNHLVSWIHMWDIPTWQYSVLAISMLCLVESPTLVRLPPPTNIILSKLWWFPKLTDIHDWLVVSTLWKIWKSAGITIPNILKVIKCVKPPTSISLINHY